MAFDPLCYDLAEAFLDEEANVTEADKSALAQNIQTAIEHWLDAWRRCERCDGSGTLEYPAPHPCPDCAGTGRKNPF